MKQKLGESLLKTNNRIHLFRKSTLKGKRKYVSLGLGFVFLSISLICYPQNEIKKLERRRKETLQEIANTTQLLQQTKKTTSNLLERLKLIASQIASRQQLINILNQETASITAQEGQTQKEIGVLEGELKNSQNAYAHAIRSMAYKKMDENKLLFILSGRSLGESMRRMRYLREYSEWRDRQAEDIISQQKELKAKKEILENAKKDKLVLLSQRKTEQSNLTSEEADQKEEVAKVAQEQKDLKQIIIKKQRQANALNAQIEKLIAEEVARQEREAKRIAAEKERLAEKHNREKNSTNTTRSTTKKRPSETVTTSPADVKLSTSFAANKGRLPMPVTGQYSIIGRFGTQNMSEFVKTNSNGIDIQAQAGSSARAVFDGVVSRIIAFPGYNNCIIIRHGGYYTFYGNIQRVSVKQGEHVRTGQSLGSIYTDSDTGYAQLHFQLWKGTNKLNPQPWLRQ